MCRVQITCFTCIDLVIDKKHRKGEESICCTKTGNRFGLKTFLTLNNSHPIVGIMTVISYCVPGILLKCPFVLLARTFIRILIPVTSVQPRSAGEIFSLLTYGVNPPVRIKEVNCLSIAMDTERGDRGCQRNLAGLINVTIHTGDVHDTLRTGTHINAPRLPRCSFFY